MVTGDGICLFLPLDWNSSATRRFTSTRISIKCSFDAISYIVSTNALTNQEPYSELRHETYPGTVAYARTKSASVGSAPLYPPPSVSSGSSKAFLMMVGYWWDKSEGKNEGELPQVDSKLSNGVHTDMGLPLNSPMVCTQTWGYLLFHNLFHFSWADFWSIRSIRALQFNTIVKPPSSACLQERQHSINPVPVSHMQRSYSVVKEVSVSQTKSFFCLVTVKSTIQRPLPIQNSVC